MPKFTVEINTDEIPFTNPGTGAGAEVARILRAIAVDVEGLDDSGDAVDFSGQTVGDWGFDD